MSLTESVSAVLASVPTLTAVEAAAKAFVAEVEAALPAADRSAFESLFTAAVGEIASLASGDPTVTAKLKSGVHDALHRVGHLLGSISRDVADAVDPTATVVVTADATVAAPVVKPVAGTIAPPPKPAA